MTPEGKVQAYLKRRVRETAGEYRRLKWIGRKGAPDCFVWWPETDRCELVTAFIEVKRQDGDLRIHQEREIGRMSDGGIKVFVVQSQSEVDGLISALTLGRSNS
jgi:hypothetical protein